MSYDDSIRIHPSYQYTYGRSPLYCLVDRETTKITSTGFWMDLDGCLDAPECMPIGSTHGSDRHGSCAFKNFVSRGWTPEESKQRNAYADKLIAELLAELKALENDN